MIIVADCGGSKYELGIFSLDGQLIHSEKNALHYDLISDHTFFKELSAASKQNETIAIVIGVAGLSRLTNEYLTKLKHKISSKTSIQQVSIISDVELLQWQLAEKELGISIGTGSVLSYSKGEVKNILGGLGFLYNDYLSGWWWFQQLFEVSMRHLENRSDLLGFEDDFLQMLCLHPDRKSLIHYAYDTPRNLLASHASTLLLNYANNPWILNTAKFGAQSLLKHIENFDLEKVFLQGGMVTTHSLIRNSIANTLKEKNITMNIEIAESLLLGGYRHWVKNQLV